MTSRSLGTLTLDLVAKIGGYSEGLDKAEREARKRSQAIEKAFDAAFLGIAAGLAAIGTGAVAAFAGLDKLVTQAGNFQDVAEKIGGNAEGIASFSVALGTAGTSVDTFAAASVRLTKGLTGVDDESKAAGAAIAALGLDLKDFKRLAPEAQMEQISKALAGFEDGASKTAVAVALFGKSGAELLPFLKALEEQGGRQVILTAEQIRQADEYADKVARVKTEVNLQAQAWATNFIPVMSDVFDILVDVGKAFAQSDAAALALKVTVGTFVTAFQTVAIVGANVAFVFAGVGREAGAIAAQLVALAKLDFNGFRAIGDAVKEDAARARAELDAFEKRVMAIGTGAGLDEEARRRLGRGTGRPTLAFDGAEPKDKKAKKEADGELKEARRVAEERQRLRMKEYDEIEKFFGDQRIEAQKTADAQKKAIEDRLKAMLDKTPSAILAQERADVQQLTAEYQKFIDTTGESGISEEIYLEAVTARLDLVGEKIKETKSFAEEFGLSFTSALEDAIVTGGKFSDMLKGIGQDILRLLVRESITEPLFKSIKGVGGGGGLFDGLLKNLFSSGSMGGGFGSGADYGNMDLGLNFEGGGSTGNGSRSGGLDGKGGFMAMLHPQETVIDHTRGGGGGPLAGAVFNIGAGASINQVAAGIQQGVAAAVGIVAESRRRRGAV